MTSLFYGLTNGGATCWLNATYQSLISLDPLMEVLFRRALAMNPARLALAHEINSRLVAKFFGFGMIGAQTGPSPIVATILPQTDEKTRDEWVRLASIIDSLSNPESFYASEVIKAQYTSNRAESARPFPLATCALINYGRNNRGAMTSDTLVDDPRSDSALRLFGALVIYCAAMNARPVPEYHSIGEVGPAMLETIIGALCWENSHGVPNTSGEQEIRSVFGVHICQACLCFDHAEAAVQSVFSNMQREVSTKNEVQMCIQVVPPSIVPDKGQNEQIARESFISNIQCAVDICEKNCGVPMASTAPSASIASAAQKASACRIPSIMSVEIRKQFGPVIAIMTDDSVARGLTSPSVTSVYRRTPIGNLCVPREITLMTSGFGADASRSSRDEPLFMTYRLVAQIIQEGGHFTAITSRLNEQGTLSHAYASDRHVSPLPDMVISPGCCALFYTMLSRVPAENEMKDIRVDDILSRAICRSMSGYIALNAGLVVTPSSGMTPQPLGAGQSIVSINAERTVPTFKDFYLAAMRVHVTLSLRTVIALSGLETLFANKIGAKYCGLLSQMVLRTKKTSHTFEADDLAIWRFCTNPVMIDILSNDEGDKLRMEIERRARDHFAPLSNLATHPLVLAHSQHEVIADLIAPIAPSNIPSASPNVSSNAPSAPPAILMSPSYVPTSLRQYAPPNAKPSDALPMMIYGGVTCPVASVPVQPVPPITAFPRRMAAMARQGAPPPYITPDLSLAYERYQLR